MIFAMRTVKIKPGSWTENKFLNLLKRHDVKMELVMKRSSEMSGKPYDEYMLSDGLYKIIQAELEKIRGA